MHSPKIKRYQKKLVYVFEQPVLDLPKSFDKR